VEYLRSLPSLWADAGPDGRQALATAIFGRTDVMGFERLEYELTPDAIELELDAALPAMFELTGTNSWLWSGREVSRLHYPSKRSDRTKYRPSSLVPEAQ
jgi:hypothetical protein